MSNRLRSSTVLRISLACSCALAVASVAMAESSAFLSVKGAKQGEIKGGVTLKGREGTIKVVAVAHQVVSPMDVASGQATGKRQHKPLVITKEIDKSSPLLHAAQASNEALSEVELQLYGPSPKGTEMNHYTITLKNARVAAIELVTDEPGAGKPQLPILERVSFAYDTITWTWNDGGITATDGAAGAK